MKSNRWSIMYNVDLNTRIIVKEFKSDTRKEANDKFKGFCKSEENKNKDKELFLESRNVNWWRIYKKDKKEKFHRFSDRNKTIFIFKACNRDLAYNKYEKYCKDNNLDMSVHFYTSAWGLCSMNKDGSVTERHMFSHDFDDKTINHDDYDKNCYELGSNETRDRISNDIGYYVKTGHSKNEWYDLGFHVLEDLKHNIPILMKKGNSYPSSFMNTAKTKITSNPVKYGKYKGNEDSLASMLWKEELEEFHLNLCLYDYFSNSGIVDEKDKKMKEIDLKYSNMLPIYRGTEFDFDYKKLHSITEGYWKVIMKWMEKYLRNCWD